MAKYTLNEAYKTLIEKVHQDDLVSQNYYLSAIAEMRNISVSYLLSRGCIFIPNDGYIEHYLGRDAHTWGLEFYDGQRCLWNLYLTIPIQDLSETVVGLTGWDAWNKMQQLTGDAKDLTMYRVSSKNVFNRDKYFLSDIKLLRSTFSSRTIFVTDGVFDSIALNYRGIPAIALLGSTISKEVLYFLRWYDRVYVVPDNDSAGINLYNKMKRSLPHVYKVTQSRTKDIEELLRGEDLQGPVTTTLKEILTDSTCKDVDLGILF